MLAGHDATGTFRCGRLRRAGADGPHDSCNREREAAVIEFRHILCPIDFSETSIRALTYAAAFASWYEAQLEVLHVVKTFDSGLGPAMSDRLDDDRPYPASHDGIISQIGRAITAAGAAGVNARALAQEGRAQETIVSRARAQTADLLVLGTHGRSGFNRLLLGSVTEKVLRTAPCPVLIVPPAVGPMTVAPVALKRILCPMDFSPSALEALHYALDLGRQAGGSVTVLHALEYMDLEERPQPPPFDPCYNAIVEGRRHRQQRVDHARERLHTQLAQEPTTWCEIEQVVSIDRAYKAILRHAAEDSTDVIVMGAQGTGGLELMLYGSNTQHVVRAATCPVMTVRA
jgi:nucleotide-binding universal stress UspA family protein